MFKIYWLISQNRIKTYVGLSSRLEERLREHKNKKVFSTKNFGEFQVHVLEEVEDNISLARKREKYWKSNAGRKKLKEIFKTITVPSSNG